MKTSTTQLTQRRISEAVYRGPEPRRDIRWDQKTPGFGLRIYPSGKKAFVLRYRSCGRERLMVLGSWGALTLYQARKLARDEAAALDKGPDPLDERMRRRTGTTIRELVEAYIDRHAKVHKKTWRKDESRLERHVLPKWRNRQAISIRFDEVAALHHRIGKDSGPYEANRTAEVLRAMFNWGGVVDDKGKNPARFRGKRTALGGIQRFTEVKRDRWVKPNELPRLTTAIDREQDPYTRAALWLYLLTGLRKNELLGLKRVDIDWERKELRIGETKSGEPHYLPLAEPALALLRQIPELAGNPFAFPGRKRGQHLVNIDKAWRRVRRAADIEDVRLHDLRRTLGSWLAQAGNSLHLIGRVLNHASPATTAIYARLAQDNVRDALEAHGKRLMAIARGEKADVVTLKR